MILVKKRYKINQSQLLLIVQNKRKEEGKDRFSNNSVWR